MVLSSLQFYSFLWEGKNDKKAKGSGWGDPTDGVRLQINIFPVSSQLL